VYHDTTLKFVLFITCLNMFYDLDMQIMNSTWKDLTESNILEWGDQKERFTCILGLWAWTLYDWEYGMEHTLFESWMDIDWI
jgi:hypothetical protein